ncbi:predicted protein, partial [Nematostella vectensis]
MSNITRDQLQTFKDSEPAFKHHILSWSLVGMIVFSIFGNVMLFVSVYRKPSLRTRTNLFILNLASADLGVTVLCMPFSVVTCSSQKWIFGDSVCQFNGFVNILFAMSSLFTLTAISVEKYFANVKPLYKVVTRRRAQLMVVSAWLGSLVFASLPLFGFTRYKYKKDMTQCGVQIPVTPGQMIHAILVFICGYTVPLGIMGFAYVEIFKAARRHNHRLSRVSVPSNACAPTSAQKQIAVTVFIMLVVCLLCWTPYFGYVITVTLSPKAVGNTAVKDLGIAAYWCAFLNSTLDPYIYGMRNPQFMAVVKETFVSV